MLSDFSTRLMRPWHPIGQAIKLASTVLLALGAILLCIHGTYADNSSSAPVVSVSGTSLQGEVDTSLSSPISASVQNAPQLGNECTMTEQWTFSVGSTFESDTSPFYFWVYSSNASSSVDPTTTTDPSTTFTGTYSQPGFYATEISASVTYTETNTVTGVVQTYGPYSSDPTLIGPSITSSSPSLLAQTSSSGGTGATGPTGPTETATITGAFKRPGTPTYQGTDDAPLVHVMADSPSFGPTVTLKESGSKTMKVIYQSNGDKGNGHVTTRSLSYVATRTEYATINVAFGEIAGTGTISAGTTCYCDINGDVKFNDTLHVEDTAGRLTIGTYIQAGLRNYGPFSDSPKGSDDASGTKTENTPFNHTPTTTVTYALPASANATCSTNSGTASNADASVSINVHAVSGQITFYQGFL